MNRPRLLVIVVLLAVLIGVPLLLSPRAEAPLADALELIIITPHNEQIRSEFGHAFDRWHQQRFGQRVNVIWSNPGGTSDIQRMLQAQYAAQLEQGDSLGGNADLVFGGGSYEHNQFKKPITTEIGDEKRSTTISIPAGFDHQWLEQTYGENRIGDEPLYDSGQYWFGTALSGFGIVSNRDVLKQLGVSEPQRWADLAEPRLLARVALVNPAQSGSITTAFDAILQRRGWVEGWRIIRRAAANARYFSGSASKAPIDVSRGDAAAGICIDFYGRFQAQEVREADLVAGRSPGDGDRLGYIDPFGETSIDADPISMLRGAVHPELAQRFIEFCLSEQGQALWQFRVGDSFGDVVGPQRFELRRMPILRSMYQQYFDRFIDKVNPFEIARRVEKPNRDMRAFIAPLFTTMAMENHPRLVAAWKAIVNHPAYPREKSGIVTAADVDDPILKSMLDRIDAMPSAKGPDGTELSLATDEHLAAIRKAWATPSLWPPESNPREISEVQFSRFFERMYQQVVELAETGSGNEHRLESSAAP